MRIRIIHETTFSYTPPTRSIIQNLRLTPRSFDSQYVLRWRVATDFDSPLRHDEDSLGNIVHAFSCQKPLERVVVTAEGEVETTDAVGVVRGSVEPLPPALFLRVSDLAEANGALREFALAEFAGAADPLDKLHRLMGAIHREIVFDPEAGAAEGGAAEALALKKAAAADFAHVFIAAARMIDIPARFISGFVLAEEDDAARGLTAWAEAYAPGLGWIAFDPVADLCADANYVRVAVGFDAASAKPIRAAHASASFETIATRVEVR